jgi:hypothetical protein
MTGVDEYGLPAGILGRHPDEFYGAIGRIVCVCAVLEDKTITLRHTLAGAQQGQHTHQPVSKQIDVARSLSHALPERAAQKVTAYLDQVDYAFRRRNELVHSSFPVQPDGRLWGHRPIRDKNVTDGSADTVVTSFGELREFICELAQLVQEFNGVHAIATTS